MISQLVTLSQDGTFVIGIVCIVMNVVNLCGGIANGAAGVPNILGALAGIAVGVLIVLAVKREKADLLLPAMIILVGCKI